ncbi:N-acetylglucosamine-6-phosphate deacetylase [Aurantimonas sp. MSK8Z-1]|uniref:N-acetylglucosamine-6-phosphate deacetylase n=1 Tax=Mangrovibrevibacter kandeliae TaxID=2968473 RepID=UPI002117D5D2|nr:N-acetylglucosamine-6-phosphate deacetylase [Aurantimonas sp. MSK8Z-1]MCW4114232.1 N-acetylglucosamine-6-phosphate deacetylase [Aurantimonas sp. MSK8Z-1]
MERPAATAFTGARIFDGESWHDDAALTVTADGRIHGIRPSHALPEAIEHVRLDGGFLAPGFVDLQVNGGGGVLFNAQPDVDGIAAICRAHARYGTVALLPTLITDRPDVTRRALDAGRAAAEAGVPGFLGLHIEGPHLSIARKGVHDPSLIRPMEESDFAALAAAARHLPVLMTTLAPETVPPAEIRRLAEAGVLVSLGHSDAGAALAREAAEAGARLVTHLYNAMSPLAHREPGMVGNALDHGPLDVGLIADGFHVDPVAIRVALRSKRGPGRIFLVTDAMSTIGTDLTSFTLNGRTIHRAGGRLTLADGTLAGADIDMLASIVFLHRQVGVPLEEALRMASLYPAEAVGQGDALGSIKPGARASLVHLTSDLELKGVWIDGRPA